MKLQNIDKLRQNVNTITEPYIQKCTGGYTVYAPKEIICGHGTRIIMSAICKVRTKKDAEQKLCCITYK